MNTYFYVLQFVDVASELMNHFKNNEKSFLLQFLVLSCRICRIICCWLSSQNQSFLFQPLDSQFEFDAISVHHNWCCFIVCFAATTKGGSTNLSLNCSPCQLIIFQLIDISFQHLFALIINHWFLNSHLVFYSTTKEILFS